jgi:hypothetical protein
MAMIANEGHLPKLYASIDRTVDGNNTEARHEHPSNAKVPIETQPGPIVTVVSALLP